MVCTVLWFAKCIRTPRPVTQRLGGTGLWGGAGGGGVAQREGSGPHGAARVCTGEGPGVDAVAVGPLPETQQIGRTHQRNRETQQIGRTHQRNPETQQIGRRHRRGPPNLAADFFLAGVVWQRAWSHRKAGHKGGLLKRTDVHHRLSYNHKFFTSVHACAVQFNHTGSMCPLLGWGAPLSMYGRLAGRRPCCAPNQYPHKSLAQYSCYATSGTACTDLAATGSDALHSDPSTRNKIGSRLH